MDELVKALLEEYRNRIDAIDRNLVHLLEDRMGAVSRIADVKAKYAVAVLDEDRERLVRENIRHSIRDEVYEPYLLQVFNDIMAASRAYQKGRIRNVDGGTAPQPGLSQAVDGSREETTREMAASPEGPVRLGLLGGKLSHSRSPEIHAAWFRLHGQQGRYELLEREPDELEALLPTLREKGFTGINVTIPYKTAIMRHLDEISPEARRMGAVNTICIGEHLVGHNTDYAGFGRLVRSLIPEGDIRHVAVLGTGGSSRAVLAWLEDHGAHTLTLVSRDPDGAAMKWPGLVAVGYDTFCGDGLDLIVNTTPLGMHPHPDASPLRPDQLRGAAHVIDLIYNPLETRLMKDARELGIPAANGLMMLVAQAVEAQAIWQHQRYDPAVTQAILTGMVQGTHP
jgi:shikimate dehydrogenase